MRNPPLSFNELSNAAPGESSAAIRERVIRARQIQEQRFANIRGIHCNAQMTESLLNQYCALSPECFELLRTAMERLQLSARAYSRILSRWSSESREQTRLNYAESRQRKTKSKSPEP